MLCPHCGTENPDTSTICSNCSESLSDSSGSPDSTDDADNIDSTDGTDSPDSETKHDEDKDSGSEVKPGNSDKPNEQTDSSTAVPDDPQVFSPPTMSPFVGDDADGSIFQPSLLSDIDYSQFNVVTDGAVADGADIPTTLKKPRSSKAIKVVGIAVLAVALCVALTGGIWFLVTSQQSSATKSEVQKLEESYRSQVDGIDVSPTEDSSRTDLLATYQDLADIQSKIDDDQAAGKFKLSDGSDDPDLVAVTSSISDKQKKIVDWFSSDYKKRLTASSFDEADSADTLDQTTIDSRISALKNLQTDIENERVIWGGNTGKGSDYSSYVNRITEQIARGNKLSKELQKKNQASAHNAEKNESPSKKAQDKWVGTYSGMGTDGLSLEIVLGSDGSVVYREGGTKVTNGSWTGDENSAQISFGGQVSSVSEPFTITSSNGGKHIAVSSDSPSWNTDYLDKQ
ncbi:zinc ribbon domain-containing protein [Lancefieldella rimae]|uniref:zinc ribbon domain-containing protein n=1 Tax=Lancefieldella rimae TaxID=1383 RepID=UPI00288AE50C|nr:zinc ribbon domain-containing protein [Lancefieldella rimae]